MLTLLVQLLLTINVLVKTTSSQYYANPYYQNMPQQYQVQPFADYDSEPVERSRSNGQRKKYGSSGGMLPEDYDEGNQSEECKCSCSECNDPKPCCRVSCYSCPNMQAGPGNPGFVFVPFPYPLALPNMRNETVTTTTISTTSSTTSTMKTPEDADDYMKTQTKNGKKYMLTSFRKTKPTWEPKYGIVPIPDTLAEKLMSQLRSVKELQARRY